MLTDDVIDRLDHVPSALFTLNDELDVHDVDELDDKPTRTRIDAPPLVPLPNTVTLTAPVFAPFHLIKLLPRCPSIVID